jgi:DNA replication ATP-dependent helicase Dna2
MSGLASLVESLKEAIPKRPSAVASHPPSSSSPLPDHEPFRLPADSPIRLRTIDEHIQPAETTETLGGEVEAVDELDEADQGRRSSGSSDDFGDFDDEMVDALEITNHEPASHHDQQPRPIETDNFAAVPSHHETDSLPTIPTNDGDSDDEFDLDEDIFAADLEQVASLYDRRPQMSTAEQEVQAVDGASDAHPPVISLLDDDDDFGDDIDADEFEAAEIAATQAPATTVRRPRTY